MKITYLANIRIPTEKPHGIHVVKMCEALANQGHQVELIVANRYNPDFKNEDVFNFYNLTRNFTIKKMPVIDILNWLSKGPLATWLTNLTFAISSFFYVLFHPADLIYSRDDTPLHLISYVTKNFIYEFHEHRKKDKKIYQKLCKQGKGLVVITKGIQQLLVKDGIHADRILVAPDAVDLDKFRISSFAKATADRQSSKSKIRQKLNLPVDKKIIMSGSSLYKWKGVFTLVETVKYDMGCDDFLIVLVGGMRHDIERLKAFMQENNLPADKILLMGHKPYKDMPEYLAAADVLVLPNSSRNDISIKFTSPLKMFEYMASQRPIVASDLPSIREILNDNSAMLVEPDNPQALAKGIKKVLANKELANRLSQHAFKDVQNYTWEKRVEKILEFINK